MEVHLFFRATEEKTLPLKMYTGDNSKITSNINIVLSTWKEAFSGLYNKPTCVSDDNEYTEMCNKKVYLENQMGLEVLRICVLMKQ